MTNKQQITDEMIGVAEVAYEKLAFEQPRIATMRDCVEAALKAALAVQPSGWRDIESAPRDGTQMLLNVGYPWPVMGCWNRCIKQWATANYQVAPVNGVWDDCYYEYETEPKATHWKPLPPAPKGGE